jgi:hypothetical protein
MYTSERPYIVAAEKLDIVICERFGNGKVMILTRSTVYCINEGYDESKIRID